MIFRHALGCATSLAGLLLATSLLAEEAAQTPPSTGTPGDTARSVPQGGGLPVDDAILATLRNAKPMPVPAAPEGATVPRRAAAQIYRAANFATFTKKLDGTAATTPPDKNIEQAIRQVRALQPPKSSEKDAVHGAMETAPVSPPGAQVEKKVFGRDDRVRIRATRNYPFRVIGLLQMKFAGDGDLRYFCSGTLIGGRSVLTAAHCLYDVERGLWPEEVWFFPGLNGDNAPFGYYPAEEVSVVSGYVSTPTRVYDWQHMLHDMGMVTLSKNAGRQLGTLGFGYNDGLPSFVGNIVGYPLDMPMGTMWRASCDIDTVRGYPDIFQTKCDTFQGSSGSGVYDYDRATDERVVYAVNVAENPQFNTGLRITGPYYAWIQQNLN